MFDSEVEMKRLLAIAALLLLVGLVPQVEARQTTGARIQPLTAEGCIGQQYTIKYGDRLFNKWGPAWDRLNETNPGLQSRTTMRGGEAIVMLYPTRGDVLCIPNGMEIGDYISNDVFNPDPIRQTQAVEEVSPTGTMRAIGVVEEKIPAWVWFLLILLAVAALYLFFLLRKQIADFYAEKDAHEKTKDRAYNSTLDVSDLTARIKLYEDPVTSGPAFVPEGVTLATAPQHFQNMAVRKWESETNRGFVEPELMSIMSITSGTGRGKLHILYRDGKWEERILTGQRMFRGVVRFPDGKLETLFMLQGCGNDVRFSGNRNMPMGDFVFTPDSEPVPVTQVAPTPVASAPETAGNQTEVRGVVPDDFDRAGTGAASPIVDRVDQLGHEVNTDLKFVFKRRRTDGRPMLIEVNGIDTNETEFTVNVTGSSVSLRLMD